MLDVKTAGGKVARQKANPLTPRRIFSIKSRRSEELRSRKHVGTLRAALPRIVKALFAEPCTASSTILADTQALVMSDYSKFYVFGAFLLGVTLTAAFNKQSASERPDDANSKKLLKQQQKLVSRFAKINDLDTLKKSLVEIETSLEKGAGSIKEGIEGCIGGTPLIKIKSLSEYTGCEILAKAEVQSIASL